MRILLLNQTFYPDVVSTAQHLSDLAVGLVERGHEVTVIASRRAYDDPTKHFQKNETWRGVQIIRVGSTGFGKGAKWKRALDFGSFMLNCAVRLLFSPRPDAIVALTSPPLISFLGALMARVRGCSFFYWVMDFNPDEAIAAGWLRERSFAARLLDRISRFSLRHAEKIIALDRFMAERIRNKGISPDKIATIPPWSHDSEVRFDAAGRDRFRLANGLNNKFVVMYSGNHSPCHPLTTLLEAAKVLCGDPEIAFCFIGGGSEFQRVREFAAREGLSSIKTIPYQPLNELSASLSAADLHVVVMGDPFVGLVHPCKVYNVLCVSAPILYIGPEPAHIPDTLHPLNGRVTWGRAGHGDVNTVIAQINRIRRSLPGRRETNLPLPFLKSELLPKLIQELESSKTKSETEKKIALHPEVASK